MRSPSIAWSRAWTSWGTFSATNRQSRRSRRGGSAPSIRRRRRGDPPRLGCGARLLANLLGIFVDRQGLERRLGVPERPLRTRSSRNAIASSCREALMARSSTSSLAASHASRNSATAPAFARRPAPAQLLLEPPRLRTSGTPPRIPRPLRAPRAAVSRTLVQSHSPRDPPPGPSAAAAASRPIAPVRAPLPHAPLRRGRQGRPPGSEASAPAPHRRTPPAPGRSFRAAWTPYLPARPTLAPSGCAGFREETARLRDAPNPPEPGPERSCPSTAGRAPRAFRTGGPRRAADRGSGRASGARRQFWRPWPPPHLCGRPAPCRARDASADGTSRSGVSLASFSFHVSYGHAQQIPASQNSCARSKSLWISS